VQQITAALAILSRYWSKDFIFLRLTAYGLRLTVYGGRPTVDGLRPTVDGLRLTAYGLRFTAYGLRPTAYDLRFMAYGLRWTVALLLGKVDSCPFKSQEQRHRKPSAVSRRP
jgi:hypothetical protein